MLITVRSFTTTQRLHSYKFTLVDKTFSALPGCCPLRRTPFSNLVRMRNMAQSRSKTKDYNLVAGSETGLCACVFLHSNPFTLEILCSDALGDCSRSFALKKAVLTANTLQISELFSHLQCALKRVIFAS